MLSQNIERIFCTHQRCKEITRLHRGGPFLRVVAGFLASLTGWRIYLRYKLFRVLLPEPLKDESEVVISMTSFPARIKNIWMVIDTLMRQQLRPAQIYLCLCEEEFPDRKLPQSLAPYLERGLTVLWVNGPNLRPHNKYQTVFLKERNDRKRLVVTVDDDLFYAPDMLSRLMALHSRYPDAVCCNHARRIKDSSPYAEWPFVLESEGPTPSLLALGYAGVLYPPNVYDRDCFYEKEKLMKLALWADDLWLRFCESQEGIGVAVGPYFALPPEVPFSQRVSLASQNVRLGRNNQIWADLNSAE